MLESTIFQIGDKDATQNPALPNISQKNSFFQKFSLRTLIKIVIVLFIIPLVLFTISRFVTPDSTKKPAGKVTLSYWGFWEKNIAEVIISDFEKENPNIKINYFRQDQEDYREKLVTRIQNGNKAPDIFRFHNTWYPMLKDILLPLPKETIEKKEFSDNYYEVAENDLIKNGAIYGIPLEVDTLSLYINTSLLGSSAVPTTWQEFVDVSQTLTKRNENGSIEIAGAALGTYENVAHAPDIISLLFAQNGVDFDDIYNSETKMADALRFYTNFALVENNVWDETFPTSTLAFSSGKLAMYFGYSWDQSAIKANNPSLSFKIVRSPQLLKEENKNIASYWVEGVSVASKHPKEALLFMKYLAKKETFEKLNSGKPSGNKKVNDRLKEGELAVFVDQAETAVSSPFVDQTYDNGLNDELNLLLKEAIDSILTTGSVESSVKSLLEGYLQTIGQYGPTPEKQL